MNGSFRPRCTQALKYFLHSDATRNYKKSARREVWDREWLSLSWIRLMKWLWDCITQKETRWRYNTFTHDKRTKVELLCIVWHHQNNTAEWMFIIMITAGEESQTFHCHFQRLFSVDSTHTNWYSWILFINRVFTKMISRDTRALQWQWLRFLFRL